MEDTSFVSFVSSCLLEPEREALASKMNEDDDLSHLHDEAFLDCKFFAYLLHLFLLFVCAVLWLWGIRYLLVSV